MKIKAIEKVVKGFANHRRIEIMLLLDRQSGLSLWEIADRTKINFKTASEHVRRLALAGLVDKKYQGNTVRHTLSNTAKSILKFLRILE